MEMTVAMATLFQSPWNAERIPKIATKITERTFPAIITFTFIIFLLLLLIFHDYYLVIGFTIAISDNT